MSNRSHTRSTQSFQDFSGIAPTIEDGTSERTDRTSMRSTKFSAASINMGSHWSQMGSPRRDDLDSIGCVLVISRGGKILVNFWQDKQFGRQNKFDTQAVARTIIGYQLMLKFPPLSKMALSEKIGCAIANGGYCTLALLGERQEDMMSSTKIAASASHLCSVFEASYSSKMQMLKVQEDLQAEKDRTMNTDSIMADATSSASKFDPFSPATHDNYKDFEGAVVHALNDKSSTLRGIVHSLAKCSSVLLSAAYNFTTGTVLASCTSERLPWAIDASPATVVRKAREQGSTYSPHAWFNLRGLYNSGNGMVWKVVNEAWLEAGEDETSTGFRCMTLYLTDDEGREVEVHSCMDSVVEEGELVRVVVFCVGVSANDTTEDNATAFAQRFALVFPLRSISEVDPLSPKCATGLESTCEETFMRSANLIASLPKQPGLPVQRAPRSLCSFQSLPSCSQLGSQSQYGSQFGHASTSTRASLMNPLAPPRSHGTQSKASFHV